MSLAWVPIPSPGSVSYFSFLRRMNAPHRLHRTCDRLGPRSIPLSSSLQDFPRQLLQRSLPIQFAPFTKKARRSNRRLVTVVGLAGFEDFDRPASGLLGYFSLLSEDSLIGLVRLPTADCVHHANFGMETIAASADEIIRQVVLKDFQHFGLVGSQNGSNFVVAQENSTPSCGWWFSLLVHGLSGNCNTYLQVGTSGRSVCASNISASAAPLRRSQVMRAVFLSRAISASRSAMVTSCSRAVLRHANPHGCPTFRPFSYSPSPRPAHARLR